VKKTTLLRNALKETEVLMVPVVYDCMSARVAETVGFKAVFMPVSITTMIQIGLPPIGLATASEIINCTKYTADSVNVPLILSADDGYGGTLRLIVPHKKLSGQELPGCQSAIEYLSLKQPFRIISSKCCQR